MKLHKPRSEGGAGPVLHKQELHLQEMYTPASFKTPGPDPLTAFCCKEAPESIEPICNPWVFQER